MDLINSTFENRRHNTNNMSLEAEKVTEICLLVTFYSQCKGIWENGYGIMGFSY